MSDDDWRKRRLTGGLFNWRHDDITRNYHGGNPAIDGQATLGGDDRD